ncbi:MAG: alanine racemase [Acidimicrobiales bacterium]
MMFLDRLRRRNPALPMVALDLHRAGKVVANTYLIDLDTVRSNAASLASAAAALGLSVYFMAKQYGRNPDVSHVLVDAGLGSAVAVDVTDMATHVRHGVPVGHVGHLVQAHSGSEDSVIAAHPEVVTVFSVPAARRLGPAAVRAGRCQPVLLRVHAPGDFFYFGHGGGFPLDGIERAAAEVDSVEGIAVTGVTTFPCLLADPQIGRVVPTPNLSTLVDAAQRLSAAGFAVAQVNAPGTTSVLTLETLAAAGATHVEPGNALHGTTPLHILREDAPEDPAIVYVSEVSHFDGEDAYVFAAGHYVDKVLGDYPLRALCGHDESLLDRVLPVKVAPDGAIHYYYVLPGAQRSGAEVGDTVVFCFRPQVFVTRGRTQAIAGLHGDGPTVLYPRYDVEGYLCGVT